MGIFNVRLDDETKARWQEAADREGVKLTEWVRRAAEARANPAGARRVQRDAKPFTPDFKVVQDKRKP